MKKLKIIWIFALVLVVGGAFFFSGAKPARAVICTTAPSLCSSGGIAAGALTPSPADTQITITGTATGYVMATVPCSLSGGAQIASPVTASYSIDGVVLGSVPLVQVPGTGTNSDCTGFNGGMNPPGGAVAYQYNFTLVDSTHIAALSNGSHTLTITLDNVYAAPYGVPFTVSHSGVPPQTGIISVTSADSQNINTPVPATWYFYTDPQDPCASGSCVNQTYQKYTSLPMGSYTICSLVDANCHATQSALWSLRSVQQVPIAQSLKNWFVALEEFGRGIIFPHAMALCVNGTPGLTPPSTCDPAAVFPASSWNLSAGSPSASYIMLWDPHAVMNVSPSSVSLSGVAGGSSVTTSTTVSNSGAPGSRLTWVATSDKGWLSVSPSSDGSGVGQGGSDAVTIKADPSGLSASATPYTGTITFAASSTINGRALLNETVTVNFAVGSASNPVSVTAVNVACNPTATSTSGSSQCTAGVVGTGAYDPTVTWSTNNGTISQGGHYLPGTVGTATVTACSNQVGYTNVCGTAPITITSSLPPLPDCTTNGSCPKCLVPALSANPSSIVVPESSNLDYNCQHITSCTLSGGGNSFPITYSPDPAFPGTPIPTEIASGTAITTPSTTTVYTLACTNDNDAPSINSSINSTVTVTVGGSGLCETNPNAVGCPGH